MKMKYKKLFSKKFQWNFIGYVQDMWYLNRTTSNTTNSLKTTEKTIKDISIYRMHKDPDGWRCTWNKYIIVLQDNE